MPSIVSYLEMTSREEFSPVEVPEGLEARRVDPPDGRVNARMYRDVGGAWEWHGCLEWPEERWQELADGEGFETWLAYWEGELAGYFELDRQEGGDVEILHFGLLPTMIGKGLGKAMLTVTIEQAWSDETTKRVWLHTCTEDHPHALSNYQKRGFRLYKTEEE